MRGLSHGGESREAGADEGIEEKGKKGTEVLRA